MVFGVIGAGVDQAHHFHDALDAVQVAAGGDMQGTQQVNGDRSSRNLTQSCVHIGAQLSDPRVAVLLGDMAADKHQIPCLYKGNIGSNRRGQWRQDDVQFFESLVNIHEGLLKNSLA